MAPKLLINFNMRNKNLNGSTFKFYSHLLFLFLFVSISQAEDKCSNIFNVNKPFIIDLSLRKFKWQDYKETVIEANNLTPISLENKDYWLYKNANISVNITHGCNAMCGFCVDGLRKKISEDVHINKENIIATDRKQSTELYLAQFQNNLKSLESKNISVSITGGEPTLDAARLGGILHLLKKYKIRKRVMTTNGTMLLQPIKGQKKTRMIDMIIENGLEHMNISRAHYDENINQEIMKFKPSFSNEELKKAINIANKSGIRVRLSVALLKEGIHDLDGIKTYLDWAKSMGVDNVIFRQLMDYDKKTMQKNWVTDFYEKEGDTAKLDEIYPEIDLDKSFKLVKQHVGYYYYVEVYKYKQMDVVFEVSDLTLLDRVETRKPLYHGAPIIYELIFQDNANLEGTWQPGAEVIVPGPAELNFTK